MVLPVKLIGAIAVTTAAVSAAAYWTTGSQKPPRRSGPSDDHRARPGASAPVAGPDDVKLCVGGDRVLWATPEGADECPAGQEELLLAWDSDERLCELCDPLAVPPAAPV